MRAALIFLGLVAALPAQPSSPALRNELRILRTHIGPTDPIEVDVWVENPTDHEVSRPAFSPLSSIVGLPKFLIRRLPVGVEFSLPPGLYGEDGWHTWYVPGRNLDRASVGRLMIGPRQRVHLLQGDLRQTILRSREHCRRALADERGWRAPDTASTRQHYEDIVRFADDFLSGGTFEIRVDAYAVSPPAQITVDPLPAKETL